MKGSDNRVTALAIVALVLAVGAGLLAWVALREESVLRTEVNNLRKETSEARELVSKFSEEIQALGTEATLYFVKETPTAIQLGSERRRILSGDLPFGVMTELIKGPAPGSSLRPSVPPDTTLNSVKIRDSIAYVDLGGGIAHLNTGSEGEAAVVYAIVDTLTGLPGVKKVQILVNGQTVESLAGHVDVSVPLTRSNSL